MTNAEPPKGTPENPVTRDYVKEQICEFKKHIARVQQIASDEADLGRLLKTFGASTIDELLEYLLVLTLGAQMEGHEVHFAQDIDLTGLPFSGEVEVAGKRRLWRANFSNSILRGANFEGAPLQRADFQNATLEWARFSEVEAQGARFDSANLFSAEFWRANLQGAYFKKAKLFRARLQGAQLQGADLSHAHFEGAWLTEAELQGTILFGTTLHSANLDGARLRASTLSNLDLDERSITIPNQDGSFEQEPRAKVALEKVNWYHGFESREEITLDLKLRRKVIHEEAQRLRQGVPSLGETCQFESSADYLVNKFSSDLDRQRGVPFLYSLAESGYRRLKQWFTNRGEYSVAGEFFYREMECRRKALPWWPLTWEKLKLEGAGSLFGYGERPLWVVGWTLGFVFGLPCIYWLIGAIGNLLFGAANPPLLHWIYFSMVSFTALGYASWVDSLWHQLYQPWSQAAGFFEALLGIFMMALFLTTFVRKMTR